MTNPLVIILGAGRPYRGSDPSALVRTDVSRRVLDWTLDAFGAIPAAEFHFVGGYRVEEVIRRYPRIHYSVNTEWEASGSLGTLLSAPLEPGREAFVCYSDVVFRPAVVERLLEAAGDVVLVGDTEWHHRYAGRSADDLEAAEKLCVRDGWVTAVGSGIPSSAADAEFIGLLRLSPRAVAQMLALRERPADEWRTGSVPGLVEHLLRSGLDVRAVNIVGDWAELNAPQDLARFVLGTKAETLDRLRPQVRRSVIDNQVSFTLGAWETGSEALLREVSAAFEGEKLVVRSSALSEDGWSASNAGGFASVLDVPAADPPAVRSAIQRVFDSYGDDHPGHQVLVQAMVPKVVLGGVVLTRTLNHGAPYFTVNYDDSTASTDSVTSGSGLELRTCLVHRDFRDAPPADARLAPVLDAARELEELVGYDSLDIEFALSSDGRVHVFQLRPIAVDHDHCKVSDPEIAAALAAARQRLADQREPGAFLLGSQPAFGVMPDWNPAEIVGPKPRRLALSLYRHLITDEVWARQRAEYGYRDVRPCPLIRSFAGHPYVDVRASFNSFVPAALSDDLARRLVEHYVARLRAHPHLHDKVEFEVAFTCRDFDFEQQAQRLRSSGFSAGDVDALSEALGQITQAAFARCEPDLEPIRMLEQRFDALSRFSGPPLERAVALLEDCRGYGTLAFAHAARTAFVAVSLLRSLERLGVTTRDANAAFLNSLSTVAKGFEQDAARVAAGELSADVFRTRYGHLRPGTYEITRPSYAEAPELYLDPLLEAGSRIPPEEPWPGWSQETRTRIAEQLGERGLPEDVGAFERFLRRAIEGREYAKFAFTRNISAALEALAAFGRRHDLSREALSHLSLGELLEEHRCASAEQGPTALRGRAETGRELDWLTQAVELPPLLFEPDDVRCFEFPRSQPNFISRGVVTAEPAVLDEGEPEHLEGRIALIRQADPGYDWLFGRGIVGLVTLYGGANSHMAIRCAEFGLPAAIGVGPPLYERLARARVLELDCASQRIRMVR